MGLPAGPLEQNITRIRNAQINLRGKVTDENDVAVNLTGATMRFLLKLSRADTDANAKIAKTITTVLSAAGQIDDPTNGRYLFKLAPGDTSALDIFDEKQTVYHYTVYLKDSAPEYHPVTIGEFRFDREEQQPNF